MGSSGLSKTAAEGTNLFAGFTNIFTLPPEMTYVPSLIAFLLAAVSVWVPIDLGFVHRMLAARDADQRRKGTYAYLALQFFVLLPLVTLGMYGGALVRGLGNPDEVVLRLARGTPPLFGAALFVSAVAAAMSTMSTYLNAAAA